MRVGWIGTGLMGLPMAHRVADAGHDLAVFTRTMAKAHSLQDVGARLAGSIQEAVRDRDAVITMLGNTADVEQAYLDQDGILAHTQPGTIVVDATTSSPELAHRLATAGDTRGVVVLDAPVSGGPFGAEQGTLSVMVGGDKRALETVHTVLGCFAATIIHQGPSGSGQLAKLTNQILVAGVTLASCEAFTFAKTSGLNMADVAEPIRSGVAGSPLFEFVWARLADSDLNPGFKLEHLLKDLALALDVGAETDCPSRVPKPCTNSAVSWPPDSAANTEHKPW